MAIKLLVADDHAATRENFCKFLIQEGYQAKAAADGAQALSMLARERFDLVICDVVMPYVSGFDIAECLRYISPATRILFVSSYLRSDKTSYEVLPKPVQLEEVLYRVKSVLREYP